MYSNSVEKDFGVFRVRQRLIMVGFGVPKIKCSSCKLVAIPVDPIGH